MKRSIVACLLGCLASLGAASAQTYPDRPITLVVPVAPGGSTDFTGRLYAEHLSTILGQPVVVENQPGAGGIIGTAAVATARPDGYTFMVGGSGQLRWTPVLRDNLPYDVLTDFAPLAQITTTQFALVVNSELPVHSVKELVDYAREHPETLSFGSAGVGSNGHISMEMFRRLADLDIGHVPYTGSGPMIAALVGNDVQVAIVDIQPALGFLQEGKLRALGLSGGEPSPELPDVPNIKNSGVPELADYSMESFVGFVAPAATPPEIAQQLSDAIREVSDMADVREMMTKQGFTPISGTSPEEFRAFLEANLEYAREIVKIAEISVE